MAKSDKTVQLFPKPENFIKTRARGLPLGSCYITPDWEESGIANILVSRKHTNGNFTLGFYLVDLKCLGIKDAFFKFNVSEDEMFGLVDYVNGVDIEYNIVHNIIYGADAFANDCGFKPHKSWTVAQFILEEDNDDIPLIDIEFGENGVPAYYVGPNDNPERINQILATLDKNFGQGNYLFYIDEEDAFEDDETAGDGDAPNFNQIYYDLTDAYREKFESNSTITLDRDHVDEIFYEKVGLGTYSPNEELNERIIECTEEYESIFEDISLESISQIQNLLVRNPDMPMFYAELFLQYKTLGLHREADAIAKKGMQLFPDFLYLRLYAAHAAMVDGELERGLELLNKKDYLDEAFPQRTWFAEGEFMLFYAALCQYFMASSNLIDAITCADLLLIEICKYSFIEDAILDLLPLIKAQLRDVH